MKVVILAGGFGTRISEESHLRPKPMIEVGGRPILWHIMKLYSARGLNEFVVCCGYKGYLIKEYFANYFLHNADVTFDLKSNSIQLHHANSEPWKVTLVDTGLETMTGGRIKRIEPYVNNQTFCLTYGDGLSDVDLNELIAFHKKHKKSATVTAIQPAGRFGAIRFEGEEVGSFEEKPKGDGSWVNGGFFVLEPAIFDLLTDDQTTFEQGPMQKLAVDRQLVAYKHDGFWMAMDTLRDKIHLEKLWASPSPPWKVWN